MRRRLGKGQRGHLMAGVVVLVALLGIFSTVAVQEYSEVLRRDNEAEMIFRAQEIVRAIQRYRAAHGQPPLKLDQLIEPGPKGEYFLRRLYEDPLVKDGNWGLLYVGPGNTVVDPSAEADVLAGLGAQHPGARATGLDRLGQQGQRPRDQNSAQQGRRGGRLGQQPGQSGQQGGLPGQQGGAFGGGQETGLPIAGVKTLCEDKPFRVYNGLTEYKEWLFTYFDLELNRNPGQNPAGQGPGGRARPGAAPGGGGPGAQPGVGGYGGAQSGAGAPGAQPPPGRPGQRR